MGRLGPGRPGATASVTSELVPGEPIHVDVKKLGRIHRGAGHRFTGKPGQRKAGGRRTDADGHRRRLVGWEFVHIAIDDATRLAYVEVLADEKAITAVGFLPRAVEHFNAYGITTQRLITDNGSAYRSTTHAIARRRSGSAISAPSPPSPDQRQGRAVHQNHAPGPTAPSTAQAPSATPDLPAGSTGTTPDDHTAPSATSRPSLASTS
jgi:hypothetical protein